MSDNKINVNKILETIDLREDVKEKTESKTKKIESPSLSEKFNSSKQEKNNNKIPIREAVVDQEQANPGGIVSASQNKRLSAQRFHEIETVLEQDLEKLYLAMDYKSQMRFKKAGEETTKTINSLLGKGKCTARKIVQIIKKWLSLIPGINKFFLEQEAKIKTDKIMNMQRKYG